MEEGLLAGTPQDAEALGDFMASIEDMLRVSPPNPG